MEKNLINPNIDSIFIDNLQLFFGKRFKLKLIHDTFDREGYYLYDSLKIKQSKTDEEIETTLLSISNQILEDIFKNFITYTSPHNNILTHKDRQISLFEYEDLFTDNLHLLFGKKYKLDFIIKLGISDETKLLTISEIDKNKLLSISDKLLTLLLNKDANKFYFELFKEYIGTDILYNSFFNINTYKIIISDNFGFEISFLDDTKNLNTILSILNKFKELNKSSSLINNPEPIDYIFNKLISLYKRDETNNKTKFNNVMERILILVYGFDKFYDGSITYENLFNKYALIYCILFIVYKSIYYINKYDKPQDDDIGFEPINTLNRLLFDTNHNIDSEINLIKYLIENMLILIENESKLKFEFNINENDNNFTKIKDDVFNFFGFNYILLHDYGDDKFNIFYNKNNIDVNINAPQNDPVNDNNRAYKIKDLLIRQFKTYIGKIQDSYTLQVGGSITLENLKNMIRTKIYAIHPKMIQS
jgi:hypothetical protein